MIEPQTVSFILLCYNQEQWVREAVRAALAQDYSPLEILISDDASTDATFESIQEEVRDYQGPHRVCLNRNKDNMGLTSHLAYAARLATGSLLVYACGDDISFPHRTSMIFERWRANGFQDILIQSRYLNVDSAGVVTDEDFDIDQLQYPSVSFLCETNQFVIGCTTAYTKALLTKFPDFIPGLVHEDCCTPFRALLLGARIEAINEALVYYRRVGITSHYKKNLPRDHARGFFSRCSKDFQQKYIDAKHLGRFDLLPALLRKWRSYEFAARCANANVSTSEVIKSAFGAPLEFRLTFKQFVKHRVLRRG